MAIKLSYAEWPEPIIQHIISFLPEKDAAKTSILSKAWMRAWRTKPKLEFDSKLFLGQNSMRRGCGREEEERRGKGFCKYVERTLKRYTEQKTDTEKMKLDLTRTTYFFAKCLRADSIVERCMQVVVETGLKNLEFLVDDTYDLPGVVLEAKLLEGLSLGGVNMLHLSTEKIMWHSLKRLCLDRVYFDEVMFENIISSCPLLEILEISYCFDNDMDNDMDESDNHLGFRVIEHHNLKKLNVRIHPRQWLILGEAPKLESLVCKSNEDCMAANAEDWIPCDLSLHSSQYQNLKMLLLCGVGITDYFFKNLEQKFPHLQDLIVRCCENLKKIRISSHSLKRIELMHNCKLKRAHFDVPNIELLDIRDDWEIIPEFSFTATKGHWISNLSIDWMGNVDSCWFLQLKKFLVNLIPSKIFLQISISGSIKLDMNEIRKSVSFSEPQEIQELSLRLSSSSILSALDGFFFICRPNCFSKDLGTNPRKADSMKLLYDMLTLRTNQDLQEIKCWQHDLMKVKAEIYDRKICRAGDAIVYLTKRLVHPQPQVLDWKSILKVLRRTPPGELRRVYFLLNWKKHSMMPNEAKED